MYNCIKEKLCIDLGCTVQIDTDLYNITRCKKFCKKYSKSRQTAKIISEKSKFTE